MCISMHENDYAHATCGTKNMWKGIMCISMHDNDTIKEANCIWVIGKSIRLYAENDAEVINVLSSDLFPIMQR